MSHNVYRPELVLRQVLSASAWSNISLFHFFILYEDRLLGLTCLFLLRSGWHLPLEHSFRATGEVTQWGGEDKRIAIRSSDTLRPVEAETLPCSPKPSVRPAPHHPHSLTFLNVKSFTCAILGGRGNWVVPLSGQPPVWYRLFFLPFFPPSSTIWVPERVRQLMTTWTVSYFYFPSDTAA